MNNPTTTGTECNSFGEPTLAIRLDDFEARLKRIEDNNAQNAMVLLSQSKILGRIEAAFEKHFGVLTGIASDLGDTGTKLTEIDEIQRKNLVVNLSQLESIRALAEIIPLFRVIADAAERIKGEEAGEGE